MKYEILTAKEAKKISDKNRFKLIETKMQPILRLIHEAVERGEYEIKVLDGDNIITDETIRYLNDLGYEHSIFDEIYDKISWK